ncbi:hemicentin-1-like isoform X1 [Macrobrachium nipponense]|uniref:hemicentin-1-like isoform X1 n=1 Tax=Macrobrachium nipponense TaxID=159736 RepID=UPI0030C7D791
MITHLALIIAVISTTVATTVREADGVTSVWVVTGGKAELPCRSIPKVPHDQPMIVLWYLSSVTKPIYSYDARDGDFSSGTRWYDEDIVEDRASFHPMPERSLLVLNPVRDRDQGSYTCRVDYRISPPTIITINLTVVIPPGPPMVIWDGRGVVGTVGPLKETERVDLTCRSVGGRPTPTITWWNDERPLPILNFHSTSDAATGTYLVEATLSISGKRELQGAPLTCQVHIPTDHHLLNSPSLHPKTVSVTLNITLPPVDVRIIGSSSIETTSGSEVDLVCQAYGSHPPTQLTWWKDEKPLDAFYTQTIEDGGNVTTAKLRMTVRREDDNKTLACKGMNPALPDRFLEDSTRLVILYAPVVELSLGRALDPTSIKEGDDVYFECNISANPHHHRIQWYHNGKELSHNVSAGIVMSGSNLVLPRLTRRKSGSYRCAAANLQGNSTSSSVSLTVRHAPVCAGPDVERTQGAVRGSTTLVTCKVEAEPAYDIAWEWMKMRVDGTEEDVAPGLIQNSGLSSSIQVTPQRQEDYGRLLCRASNAVGKQQEACVISLMPAGPPDMPTNCSALQSEQEAQDSEGAHAEGPSIIVRCLEGFDGGLRQYFLLEAWQDGQLFANMSSDVPEWILNGVRLGVGVNLNIAAHNSRGHSDPLTLEVHTSNAQQRAAPDYKHIIALAPILGAVIGGVGVMLLLLIVGVVIAKRAPQRPTKSASDLQRTSGIPEGFDPDVVQSIQRQPPSLDVLPSMQEPDGQTGCASISSDQENPGAQKYTGGKDQVLYEKADDQLRFSSLPRPKDTTRKDSRLVKQVAPYTSAQHEDSGLSDSDSDSEIKELVSKGHNKNPAKAADHTQQYINFPAEGGIHSQLAAVTDHLTEPSTSSGDSGIQSSSSTKPFSLFSTTDDKLRAVASSEFRPQVKVSGKQMFSPQSSGEQRFSPSSVETRRGLPLSLLQLSSPSSIADHPSTYSKEGFTNLVASQDASEAMNPLHIDTHVPYSSDRHTPVDDMNRHRYLEFGRPVTLLEGEHEDILLLRRTLPRDESRKGRRNSALGFSTDKIYDLSPTRYSSSSDLHSIGYPVSSTRDFRLAGNRDKSKPNLPDEHLFPNVRHQPEVVPSPSLSSFNQKDMKVMMKDVSGRGYKFPFNFNFSDRESSV